jgi:DNA mismatch repair protein MutL
MAIQKLPTNVIKLIAAGEVIDSLTAVVRELVENSLDAQATRISISLYPELWGLQVADNGEGIGEEDLPLTIEPHSTSKINSQDDLMKINTLGFRGEALHSIAQLATVSICSRVQGNCGWEIISDDGQIVHFYPKAIAIGTIVTISHLFDKLPLRRQVNPSFKQQLKQIQTLIGEFALCHPHVTWQLLINDHLYLQISGNGSTQKILSQLVKTIEYYDLKSLHKQINLESENHLADFHLVIGLPDRLSRPRPDWVKIGINGRIVKCPELESAIYSSFHRTLSRDRFPVAILNLRIPPQYIDWNRHPAKAEIYLDKIDFWQDIIKQSITEVFQLSNNNLSTSFSNKRIEKYLHVAEPKTSYNIAPQTEEKEAKKAVSLIELNVIAQARNTYIIAEHTEGIWLIEQHIAHERILYEQLQQQWEIVPIEKPIILGKLKPKQVEQLENIGLEVDSFGVDLWAIRTIPHVLLTREDCLEALLELSFGGNLDAAQTSIACRTAIRNGTPLTIKQMQEIVDQWKVTKNPHTCPHGRPIYLSLEESSLYRFFRRHWVLGKSHGITENN